MGIEISSACFFYSQKTQPAKYSQAVIFRLYTSILHETFTNKKETSQMKKDNRLSWGITLIFFGILSLLNHLNVFPEGIAQYLFEFRNYPIYAGIIFLLTNKNRTIGIVLLGIGLLLRLSDIINLTRNLSDYVWPTLLIIAGVILVTRSTKGK